MPLLTATEVSRPDIALFEPVSLSVDAGEMVGVTGPSGVGKSVLLRALADLDPTDGTVTLNGQDRCTMPSPDWRKRVCYLAAESGWWADQVGEHFPDTKRAEVMLPQLDLDTEALGWPVTRLSTGERQRLGLLRAILNDPEVLLLDEPTSALDGNRRDLAEHLIRRFADQGGGVLFVSHDEDQVTRLGHRTITLSVAEVA